MPDRASNHRPLLLGHRGARAVRSIPENTIQSFERALADGCDGFEFDVRLTADGEALICHDPHYNGIEIAKASSQQLPGLVRLERVLELFGERAFLDIELKVGGLETITLDALRRNPPRRGFVASSFLEQVLCTLHARDSTVPLGLICENREQLGEWMEVPAHYVIPHHSLVNTRLVEAVKSVRKKLLVWTVNDPKEMVRCRDMGVDGIISDDVALLSQTFSNSL
jgi:glycerophosphoryl diester phosphodiesterase